jgi:molecular chaperone Hsp33
VRAVARYSEANEARDLAALSGEGNLTVTLENEDLSQRYQGVVPLSGARLADCLREYFESSEQLPTRLWLYATEKGASGLLLQRLSEDTVHARTKLGRQAELPEADEIDDAWRRVQLIGDTLRGEELQALSDREILRRLFAEDDVRLFESTPVYFRCRCSRERVIGMLRSLGVEEIRSVLAERGEVEVRCDFCNRAYRFDTVDVEQLFAATPAADGSDALH